MSPFPPFPTTRLRRLRQTESLRRLVRETTVEVTSVAFRRPSLDDVFLKLTGRAIREEESSSTDQLRMMGRAWMGRGRR